MSDERAEATAKALRFLETVAAEPDMQAGVAVAALMAEAKDGLDYGEDFYSEALTVLAMRLACDFRAARLAALT